LRNIRDKMKTTTLAIILGIILILLLSGCQQVQKTDKIANDSVMRTDTFLIENSGHFSKEDCLKHGFGDEVIMIESRYCPHCQETKPKFIEACKELGIEPSILDVVKTEDVNTIKKHGIEVKYTPTFIIGCDYYVGEKTQQEYTTLLEKFVNAFTK